MRTNSQDAGHIRTVIAAAAVAALFQTPLAAHAASATRASAAAERRGHVASLQSHLGTVLPQPNLAAPRRHASMGLDAFGHTQLAPDCAPFDRFSLRRANSIIAVLRTVLPQYRNQAHARAAGFAPDGPDVAVGQLKHWISPKNVHASWTRFDPGHPSALLYRNTGHGYILAGAMYTAPIKTSFLGLNERVPLAAAHWHAHRNICIAKPGASQFDERHREKFGFSGTITEPATCTRAGGNFLPNVYGWMVHVYPFETGLAEQFG